MSIKYITLEEILRIHYQLIEDFGGAHGVRDEGRMKSVVEAPRQEVFGKEQYSSLTSKAALYLRNIIGDHPFSDGNKRTAVTICGIFLIRNGSGFTSSQGDLEVFTVQVATEHLSIDQITTWFVSNTK